MNKNINKIKLSITTACNLKCGYCFVKRKNLWMRAGIANKSVDLLLDSPGKEKLLSIYGGEPLLNFRLIRQLIPRAMVAAKKRNKKLTVSICTNGVLLEKEHLLFFRKYGVKLILSLVGSPFYHNKERKSVNCAGTFGALKKKIPMLFDRLNKDNLGVSLCVFPYSVNALEDNFTYISSLGFNNFNFEIIKEYEEWDKQSRVQFIAVFRKIIKNHVIDGLSRGNFKFINPISWEIKHGLLSEFLRGSCPFNYELEIYPGGEMSFSPFVLNAGNYRKYMIGQIGKSKNGNFMKCNFSPRGAACRTCRNRYYEGYRLDQGAGQVYSFYRLLCYGAADIIKERADKSEDFKNYIKKIKEEVCF